jgi:hypothetical protein
MKKCPYPGCEGYVSDSKPLTMTCNGNQHHPVKYFCTTVTCGRPLTTDVKCSMYPDQHINNPPVDAFMELHCHCPKCGINIPDKRNICPNCNQGFEYHCPFCGIDLLPTSKICDNAHKMWPVDVPCGKTFLGLCPQYPTPNPP